MSAISAILVDVIKFTGFSCLGSVLALQSKQRTWNETTQTEVSVAVKKIQQKAKLNKLCILQLVHSHVMWYLDWSECRKIKKLHLGLFGCVFLIFRVFTSATSSTFSFSSLFSLQVMQWRPSYASSTTPSTPCPPSFSTWWSSRCSCPTFHHHISAGSAVRRPTSCWSYTACCSSSRPILPTRTATP